MIWWIWLSAFTATARVSLARVMCVGGLSQMEPFAAGRARLGPCMAKRLVIRCSECGKARYSASHGLCAACYKRSRMIVCAECGETRPHCAHGLCGACYHRSRHPISKPPVLCSGCGNDQPLVREGLCADCYQREHPRAKLIVCAECGKTTCRGGSDLCNSCYQKTCIIECARCGETKRRAAHGLCAKCYHHVYRDPKIVDRMAARAEQDKALERQLAEETAERLQRRCRTCNRLLILTQAPTEKLTEFCDMFCYNHSPDRRAGRGNVRWHPKVKEKMDARKAEAERQVSDAARSQPFAQTPG